MGKRKLRRDLLKMRPRAAMRKLRSGSAAARGRKLPARRRRSGRRGQDNYPFGAMVALQGTLLLYFKDAASRELVCV